MEMVFWMEMVLSMVFGFRFGIIVFFYFWLLFRLDSRVLIDRFLSTSSRRVLWSTVRPRELVDHGLVGFFFFGGGVFNVIVGVLSFYSFAGCPMRGVHGVWWHVKALERFLGLAGFPWAVEGLTNAAATSFFKFVVAVPVCLRSVVWAIDFDFLIFIFQGGWAWVYLYLIVFTLKNCCNRFMRFEL